jgi:1-aminocyclopropane-1-carboxylate deaminase/D-cysteine desulfhydrase-like pyridoxal-dependent ACC family enzyme
LHFDLALVCIQACGSGATTAGLALANKLSGYNATVIGYGVCDDDDYFYDFIDGMYAGLGAEGQDARTLLHMRNSKGAGYAMSRCDSTRKLAQIVPLRLLPVVRTLALWSTGAVGSRKKCSCKEPLAQG